MAEYRLAPAAERDLEDIWRHGLRHWGAQQAQRYADALIHAFGELAEFPAHAPDCSHVRPGYRRRCVGRHVIYFYLTGYGIAIIRILHERMDSERHL